MSNTRVALVTGGTRGIGLGIAKKLANKGFNLVITGRRSHDEAEPTIAQLREQFSDRSLKVQYCQADVADASHRERVLTDVEATFGQLDILVNNAGIAPTVRADILEASEKSFDDAVKQAVKETSKTIRNIDSVWVKDMKAHVKGGKIKTYGVICKVSFRIENDKEDKKESKKDKE